jgi:hypothetical protein
LKAARFIQILLKKILKKPLRNRRSVNKPSIKAFLHSTLCRRLHKVAFYRKVK